MRPPGQRLAPFSNTMRPALRAAHIAVSLCIATPALLQAGCSTLPEASRPPALQRPDRAHIHAFDIEGRIATRQAERHLSGKLSWQHTPQQDKLLLSNPLGQGMAELTRDGHGARLKLADQREFLAADWDSLAAQLFELPLPLTSLSTWLVGDAPALAHRLSRDALGRPRSMTLQGWRIDYPEYESDTPDALPTRLELHQGDIDIRLKIDEWRLDTPGISP